MNTQKPTAAWLTGPIEEGEAFRRLHAEAAAAASKPRTRRRRSRFYVGLAIAFLLTVFIGFAPSFYLRPAHAQPLPMLVHVHGLVFTAWLVLLLVQSTLVAAHRVKLHRRLGIGGVLLAAIMVPLGLETAIGAARRGFSIPGLDSVQVMIFPFGSIVMFAVIMTAAIVMRRKPEIHRRLIVIATVAIMGAAIARMPFVGLQPVFALLLSVLFLIACAIHDWRTRGRVHRVYILGTVLILLSGPARYGIGHTDAWRAFATTLIGNEKPLEETASPERAPDPLALVNSGDWSRFAG